MTGHITHDAAYNAVDRDDFRAMIEVDRYGQRSNAFDGIISATHDLKMLDISDRIVWIRDGYVERIEERADVQLSVGIMENEEH